MIAYVDSSVLLMIVQANHLADEAGTRFRLVVADGTLIQRMLEVTNVLTRCDVVATRALALVNDTGATG